MDAGAFAYYTTLAVMCFLSAIMNLLILVTFLINRQKLSQNPCNKILLALSIAEFSFGVTGTVNWVLVPTVDVDIYKTVGMIPMFASALASVNILCILTFNQLVAIEYPLRHASLVTDRRVNIVSAFTLSLSIAFILIQVSIYWICNGEVELHSRSVFVTVYFAVGLLVLTISNYRLYVAIQNQRRQLQPLSSISQEQYREANRPSIAVSQFETNIGPEGQSQPRVKAKQHLKNGRICIILVIVYVINWLPLTVYRISSFFGRNVQVSWALRTAMTLATLHQILTPILYLLNRKDIRKMVRNFMCKPKHTP
ncbi:alpha-1A adrenergic receptor-like [Rhopilema esculentum]|uniref:alpha-1A adrenergic receptor-like n=1 Tax=Rhopilema esculentum TaxID=499914 RepID=UPI0031D8AC78|eukprot:gene5827-11137_t